MNRMRSGKFTGGYAFRKPFQESGKFTGGCAFRKPFQEKGQVLGVLKGAIKERILCLNQIFGVVE